MAKDKGNDALQKLIDAELQSLGIDAQTIVAWKKEHQTNILHEIAVYTDSTKTAVVVGYLKPADRVIVGRAMSLFAAQDQMGAGEFILDNCFVGGNPCLLNDDKIRISAAVQAAACIEILESSVKKV